MFYRLSLPRLIRMQAYMPIEARLVSCSTYPIVGVFCCIAICHGGRSAARPRRDGDLHRAGGHAVLLRTATAICRCSTA
jgi:hypothetical protein